MASSTLYPPLIDSYMPAFPATSSSCTLKFFLSDFSSEPIENIASIHLSIIKQSNGQNVVNKRDAADIGRYRSTGIIIINSAPTPVPGEDDLYSVNILSSDISSGDGIGWQEEWIYKVQIRLSTVAYNGSIGQSTWLNQHADDFSEWSTFCILKAIGRSEVDIPIFTNSTLDLSTLEVSGTYQNLDRSVPPRQTDETLYSYELTLATYNGIILEESGTIYTNQYYSANKIYYLFKYELQDNTLYKVILKYTTLNKYSDSITYNFAIEQTHSQETAVTVITVDNIDTTTGFNFDSSIVSEEEEGRIALKLYLNSTSYFNKKFYIRRSSSLDDFTTWEDIKYIECNNQRINELPMFYDYTIESGVWYKYGVQEYNSTTGIRGILHTNNPIIREFEFAYLIGEGGKQLKLKFNNTINTYVYNIMESKIDTIAGGYPFITRTGNTHYRTIPITGLISFNMDEKQVFTNANELYTYSDVVQLYANRKLSEHIGLYDYKLEHDFREKVIAFLQDGKPKLFKSRTEGNLIVRLMDISTQPNQSLGRMIYSFSCNGHEIADNTMENYKKYKFYIIGDEEVV